MRLALTGSIVVRSLKVSAVVGTILVCINQFDAVTGEATFSGIKAVLTYLVPYCVATFAGVRALQEHKLSCP